jgi:hypothetical protein
MPGPGRVGFAFLAKPGDMDIYCARGGRGVVAPDFMQQMFARVSNAVFFYASCGMM